MLSKISPIEVKLLNQFSALTPENCREIKHFLEYLLLKQCKAEYVSYIVHNQTFCNHLLGLSHLAVTDTYTQDVLERVKKLRYNCQKIFEYIHDKYLNLIEDSLVEHNLVKFTYETLNAIETAAQAGNIERTQQEIMEMVETYKAVLNNNTKRRHQIRAV